MKFEEAYCTAEERIISIEEARDLYQRDKVAFAVRYRESFICPECKQAALSYNNAALPYFRAYPGARHNEDCSLRQDEMSPQQTQEFLKNSNSEDAVRRQMESLLLTILSDKPNETDIAKHKTKLSTFQGELFTPLHFITSNRLPRKRIDTPFSPEDFDCYKLFYGKAILKWEQEAHDNGETSYKILLSHPIKKRLMCRIKISSAVYKYINSDYKFPDAYRCTVVFLAKFLCDSGKPYQKCTLNLGQRIQIVK